MTENLSEAFISLENIKNDINIPKNDFTPQGGNAVPHRFNRNKTSLDVHHKESEV